MVVSPQCQLTPTRSRLQHTLCQRDAGWNLILKHLFDGHILVGVEIVLKALVPNNVLGVKLQEYSHCKRKKKYNSFHDFFLFRLQK
jgi:hypothetical protein